MKIVIVIDIYDMMTNGTVMTAVRFVQELKKKGHTVRVVATGAKGEDCYEVPERYIPLVTEVARLQQIRFGKPDVETLTNAFANADVIHFYMPFKLEKKGKKIADMMGIPTTAAFHVQPENCTYNAGIKFSKAVPKLLYNIFRDTFYKNFDHIHCPSKFIAEQLQLHQYKAKLHVISNGVDEVFQPLPAPKEVAPDRFNILMIGRYANEKRQDVLLKAISLSKYKDKIHLTLAGRGPNKGHYQKLAKKYASNPVEFSFFNQKELIDKIHDTDLYVHAADIEIEAIACIEAFACGVVPLIANSSRSATPQFALDERSLFKAGSAKSLAEKIDYWIENPDEKRAMSEKYVEEGKRYGIDYSIAKAEEMFKEAIATHKEKIKLNTEEAKKQSKKFVKRSKIWRFFTWCVYYFFAAPILFLVTKIAYGLKVVGRKNLKKIKKKGAVSISNHVHLLDCAMNAIAMYPRQIAFTALKSNFDIPIAGKLLKILGGIPIPDSISDTRIFMNELNKMLKDNRVVHIYSEAHLISYYAGLREFNKGAFKFACQSQVPILPLVLSWRERKGFFKLFLSKKPCATITIGEPIYPDFLMMKKEMEVDLLERATVAMNDLYEKSNDGHSVNYFEGKSSPSEYKTKAELRKMLEEALAKDSIADGKEPDKNSNEIIEKYTEEELKNALTERISKAELRKMVETAQKTAIKTEAAIGDENVVEDKKSTAKVATNKDNLVDDKKSSAKVATNKDKLAEDKKSTEKVATNKDKLAEDKKSTEKVAKSASKKGDSSK